MVLWEFCQGPIRMTPCDSSGVEAEPTDHWKLRRSEASMPRIHERRQSVCPYTPSMKGLKKPNKHKDPRITNSPRSCGTSSPACRILVFRWSEGALYLAVAEQHDVRCKYIQS